jgi:hypothetical protein
MDMCGEWSTDERGSWKHSLSDEEASAAWGACLQEMIDGFSMVDAINELDNPNFDDPIERKAWDNKLVEMQDKKQRGLYLFAKHFDSLWD